MSKFKIVEVYSKGCLACDYAYRLMKKIGIYDNITHIENDDNIKNELKTNKVPTFFIYYDDKMPLSGSLNLISWPNFVPVYDIFYINILIY